MKNTAIRTIATAALAIALAGCGAGSASTGTSSTGDKVIKVGATAVPHAEILNDVVKDVLADAGWTLEVTEFTDYVTPNTALEDGSLDANYFQTLGYMNNQNDENGLHLAAAVGVHIEPMGIYSAKIESLDDLADGLLKDPGTDEHASETTFNGNAELNPHGYVITPVEAANVPNTLADVDVAVVNGNYALEAGLPASHPALDIEEFDKDTTIARTNFLVVKQGNEETEKTKALVEAITSDEVQAYIEDTYKGAVIASFITADGTAVK